MPKPREKRQRPEAVVLPSVPVANPARRIDYVPLSALRKAKRNPKRHAEALAVSLARFGYADPIVIDERTGAIAAGHGRLEKLQEAHGAGGQPPEGIIVQGEEWLVPVYRGWASKNDTEGEAYLLAANRVGELGGWDEEGLSAMLADLVPANALDGCGFLPEELVRFVPAGPELPGPTPTQAPTAAPTSSSEAEDEVPEVREDEVTVRFGELYQLGRHRLLVGDSFNPADVDRLLRDSPDEDPRRLDAILTDPPYAIYGNSSGVASDIADDSMIRPFFEAFFKTCRARVKTFGHVYTFCDWRSWATIWHGAKLAQIVVKNMLVWDKGGAGLGSNFANTHELVCFASNLPRQTAMGQRKAGQRTVHSSNLLRFPAMEKVPSEALEGLAPELAAYFLRLVACVPEELFWQLLAVAHDKAARPSGLRFNRPTGEERLHNAAKPVALLRELLELSSDEGETVGDFFTGSGSTMIACEKTGRAARCMEKDPRNAQITIRRWERVTGQRAELVS